MATLPGEAVSNISEKSWVVLAGLAIALLGNIGWAITFFYGEHQKADARYESRIAAIRSLRKDLEVTKDMHDRLNQWKQHNPSAPPEAHSLLGILQSYALIAQRNSQDVRLSEMKPRIDKLIILNAAIAKKLDEIVGTACTDKIEQAVREFEHQAEEFESQWSAENDFISKRSPLPSQIPFSPAIYDALNEEENAASQHKCKTIPGGVSSETENNVR